MLSKDEWKNYFLDLKKGKKNETEGGRFILGSFASGSPQQIGSGAGIAQGVLPPVSRSSDINRVKTVKKRKRKRVLKKIKLKRVKKSKKKPRKKKAKRSKSKIKRKKKPRKGKSKKKPVKKKGKKKKISKKKGNKKRKTLW